MPPWHSALRPLRSYSTRSLGGFDELISNSAHKYQVYLSRSHDPFLNLSIEHYLLQNSHKDATILFLYTNSPCVVIGRNQNPWLEVNLRLLKQNAGFSGTQEQETDGSKPVVQLVRRRSGGGTVFHDHGNVNYSVICPPAAFTRDKHAEMVTRAMRRFNPRARVNERHDIVLDQGELQEGEAMADLNDTHRTKYTSESKTPLKVSGSAFKLTRNRSLHHGTCLLASPNLGLISKYLNSPARPYMKAKGVESVRSPVGNVFSDPAQSERKAFQVEVAREFAKMYNINEDAVAPFSEQDEATNIRIDGNCCYGHLDHGVMSEVQAEVAKIKVRNLRSSSRIVQLLTCYHLVVS